MAIWNCTGDNNTIARLLELALPNVKTDAEMIRLEPAELEKVTSYANSMTDCLLSQQAALADLIANADIANLDAGTITNAGWLLRSITDLHELMRRAADMAAAYSGEDRAFQQALISGDKAKLAEIMQ